jgi:hypothetical protein
MDWIHLAQDRIKSQSEFRNMLISLYIIKS